MHFEVLPCLMESQFALLRFCSDFAEICSDLTIFSHQGELNTAANKKEGESVKVLDANRSSVLRGDEEKLTLG